MDDADMKCAISRKWDQSSDTYDTRPSHGIRTDYEKEAWESEFRKVLPPPPLNILDVGCGTGEIAILLAEMGHDVYGLDLSEEMLKRARQKSVEKGLSIEFHAGDAEKPGFGNEFFDAVVNRHLLWTLPHPAEAVTEWHRILRHGGKIIVIDGIWNDKSIESIIRQKLSRTLTNLCEGYKAGDSGYDAALKRILPHDGGVPLETAGSYLRNTGFLDIGSVDLLYIRDLQRQMLPWYQKLAQNWSYYLVYGTK